MNTPARRTPGNVERMRAATRAAPSRGTPTRPSPLSIFRKIAGGRVPAARASAATSSSDWIPTVMPASVNGPGSPSSPVGKSSTSHVMPPARSASASAGLPRDSQRTPAASRQAETGRTP